MLYLGNPNEDGETVFNAITRVKKPPTRDHLNSAMVEIFDAYDQYIKFAPDVDRLTPITLNGAQVEALCHAYDVRTTPMEKLHTDFKIRHVTCPFCRISESSTLDHYLPKSIYPEFSIFPQNLIPCCGICNTKKSNYIIDTDSKVRLFLHPYFDELPREQFLNLSVRIDSQTLILKFNIRKVDSMTETTFRYVSNHFRVLDLGNRYRAFATNTLREARVSLDRQYKHGPTAVKEYLGNEADSIAASSGSNHWRTVLFATLAMNQSFCDGGFTVIPA